MNSDGHNEVELVANAGWDKRIVVCRCALHDGGTVDHHIIVTRRYVMLLDTALNPETARLLLTHMRPHLAAGRQLLVVNTHADWDHAWGNQIFAGDDADCAAPIIGSRLCADRLRSGEAQLLLARFQRSFPATFGGVVLTPPTIVFDEQLDIDGGDLTVRLFATPGHTADHISVFIPEIKALFAGDAAEVPFPFVDGSSGVPLIRASLRLLAGHDATTVFYCHAPVTAGSVVIHHNIDYFDRLEEHCRAALAHGVPSDIAAGDDAPALVGFPLAAALPPGCTPQTVAAMYEQGHQETVRAMLACLQSSRSVPFPH